MSVEGDQFERRKLNRQRGSMPVVPARPGSTVKLVPMNPDLAAERIDYAGEHLLESDVPSDPYTLFDVWLEAAFTAKEQGVLPEPTAMVVATVLDGRPSARTVLLKEVDHDGFVFFTNYTSRKAAEIDANPYAALHFGWYPMHRQVRVEGMLARVSREESAAYFATRPRGSQLGAWASPQSSEVGSVQELQAAYADAEQRFAGQEVPCPEHWGGYRLQPESIEFWQGQPSRMHDRLRFRRAGDGWAISRLAP